ncbi:SUMF1/EgtB/PvdO family nonheme iron enzyme, partial [Akkermansiaceae bacterium]|nr:SUMF1/EgtB/PvdO family nonheme iron enzyme [Akkermansiaceae bacterium]
TQVSLQREIGDDVSLVFRKKGFHDLNLEFKVIDDGSLSMVKTGKMERSPPVKNDVWMGPLGVKYLPENESHKSGYVGITEWGIFMREVDSKLKPSVFTLTDDGIDRELVAVPEAWAAKYAAWLTDKAIKEGFLRERFADEEDFAGNREFVADYGRDFPIELLTNKKAREAKLWPFQCEVRVIPYAILKVSSTPPRALVFIEGRYVGETPLTHEVRPGLVEYSLALDGYKEHVGTINLEDKLEHPLQITLKKDDSVEWDQPWTNSLGMKFVPLDEDLMVCLWETRSGDFKRIVKKGEFERVIIDDNDQVPVSNLSRPECEVFCERLTKAELGTRLKDGNHYRLPTDEEWSRMAGLVEFGDQPNQRETGFDNAEVYPWGVQWPPAQGAGNYADITASDGEYTPIDESISDYNDGYELLAPVGKFNPNHLGLFDLGGNVREWVSDQYKEGDIYGVLRGGGFKSYQNNHLELRFRDAVEPEARGITNGFRVVLARELAEKILEVEDDETEKDNGGNND